MQVGLNARAEYLVARPYPTRKHLEEHCEKAKSEGYRAVVVPSGLIVPAYELLEGSDTKVICAVGFPFGNLDPDVKRFETEAASDSGAHEIELIPSLSRLAEDRHKEVLREIRDVVEAADERPVSVVIESHLWGEAKLGQIVDLVLESGARFLTTSIALQGRHASVEAVEHLRELVGESFGLKVGGLKTMEGAEELIQAGANRIVLGG